MGGEEIAEVNNPIRSIRREPDHLSFGIGHGDQIRLTPDFYSFFESVSQLVIPPAP
jgi:hypothetical protein